MDLAFGRGRGSNDYCLLLKPFVLRRYIGNQRYSSILSCFGPVQLGLVIYILVFPSHGLCFSSSCFLVFPHSPFSFWIPLQGPPGEIVCWFFNVCPIVRHCFLLMSCSLWGCLAFSHRSALRVLQYDTYCETGHLFIMVISEDPCMTLTPILPSVWQCSCHYLF